MVCNTILSIRLIFLGPYIVAYVSRAFNWAVIRGSCTLKCNKLTNQLTSSFHHPCQLHLKCPLMVKQSTLDTSLCTS
eukprot:jgi/Chrzof1/7760/Cz02g35220.t1